MVSLWCFETVKGKCHSSGGPDRVAAASAGSRGSASPRQGEPGSAILPAIAAAAVRGKRPSARSGSAKVPKRMASHGNPYGGSDGDVAREHRMGSLDLLPESWRSELSGASVEPLRSGSGGASVFRVGGISGATQFLKIAAGEHVVEDLRQEIERTTWLASHQFGIGILPRRSRRGRSISDAHRTSPPHSKAVS
jgi:hypothetical protein